MKVLVYTDNHFSTNSSIVRKEGGVTSLRLENQIKSLNWVEKLGKEKGCELVIHLGDFFDKPELTAKELTALKDIEWNDLPHYFLVGNHEMASADLKFNSLNALSKIGKIVDTPQYESGFGYRFIFLPYILETDRKPLKQYIREAIGDSWETQEVKKTIIFSHNDIAGIRYGQWESKVGFSVEEIYNSCDLFINGHLHNQMQINEKMLNLGNLTGQNFSEDAFKYSHCAAILDTETLKVELINNPYAFNFYKLEITSEIEFSVFENLVSPAVVTISTPMKLVEKVKETLKDFSNIVIESRVIGIPDKVVNTTDDMLKINTVSHIDQFKKYVLDVIGSSDILIEELDIIS